MKTLLTRVTLHSLGESACLGPLGPVDGRLESPELPRWDTQGEHLVKFDKRPILGLTTLSDSGKMADLRDDKVKGNDA
jgi:hypothetical protein